MIKVNEYASRPVSAFRVENINEDGIQIADILNAKDELCRIEKKPGKQDRLRMKVLVGRGARRHWVDCFQGSWILIEFDGTVRVFGDRSFRKSFVVLGEESSDA